MLVGEELLLLLLLLKQHFPTAKVKFPPLLAIRSLAIRVGNNQIDLKGLTIMSNMPMQKEQVTLAILLSPPLTLILWPFISMNALVPVPHFSSIKTI